MARSPKATDPVSVDVQHLRDQTKNPLRQGVISLCGKRRLLQIIHDFRSSMLGSRASPLGLISCSAARPLLCAVASSGTPALGKSLIMAWLAKWVIEHVDDSRVAVITDRDELDGRSVTLH